MNKHLFLSVSDTTSYPAAERWVIELTPQFLSWLDTRREYVGMMHSLVPDDAFWFSVLLQESFLKPQAFSLLSSREVTEEEIEAGAWFEESEEKIGTWSSSLEYTPMSLDGCFYMNMDQSGFYIERRDQSWYTEESVRELV